MIIAAENSISKPNKNTLEKALVPTKEELDGFDLEQSRYELLHRGGYMAGSNVAEFRHLLKKSVYMIGVGSLFAGVHTLRGTIADVTPCWNDDNMHRVLRSGRPVAIPVKKQDV